MLRPSVAADLQNAALLLVNQRGRTTTSGGWMTRVTRRQVEIIEAWDSWTDSRGAQFEVPTVRDTFVFFLELRQSRPDLFDFNPRGRDKWKIMHGWLVASGRAEDEDSAIQAGARGFALTP